MLLRLAGEIRHEAGAGARAQHRFGRKQGYGRLYLSYIRCMWIVELMQRLSNSIGSDGVHTLDIVGPARDGLGVKHQIHRLTS